MATKKELVSWEEKMAAQAKDVQAVEKPSSNFISLRSGQMSYNDNQLANNELVCVVVASMFENTYYPDKYDPNNIKSPDCFALAFDTKGLKPHENSSNPQHPQCDGCPNGEWGSDPNGGRGKACRQSRRLLVMPWADDVDITDAETAIIRLPVTSVKNWANYANKVVGAMNRPPWYVMTRISTQPDPKTQFKVNFDFVGKVEDTDALAELEAKHEAGMLSLDTPYEKNTETAEEEESTKY